MMHHAIDRQILNRNDVMLIDDLARLLVGEVLAAVSDALMHARHDLAPLTACRRGALPFLWTRLLRQTPLRLCHRPLVLAEEAWIGDLAAIREGGERREAHAWYPQRFQSRPGARPRPHTRT